MAAVVKSAGPVQIWLYSPGKSRLSQYWLPVDSKSTDAYTRLAILHANEPVTGVPGAIPVAVKSGMAQVHTGQTQ